MRFKHVDQRSKIYLGTVLIFFLAVTYGGAAISEVRNLSTAELRSVMKDNPDIVLINVLPKIIFDTRHIEGSKNVPLGQLSSINDFVQDKQTPLIFYCMGRL